MKPSRQLSDLIESLLAQTGARRIAWKKERSGAYLHITASGAIRVAHQDPEDYSIVVLDEFGNVVEIALAEDDGRIATLWRALADQVVDGSPKLTRILAEVRGA